MRIKSCIGAGLLALYAGSLCHGENNSIDYSSYLHDVQLLMKTIVPRCEGLRDIMSHSGRKGLAKE